MIHPALRDVFSDTDHRHDPWGSALRLTFSLCDVLWENGEWIPGEWEFRPSLGGSFIEDEDRDAVDMNAAYESGEVTGDELRHFGNVLVRYTRIMDTAGRSY